MDGSNLLFFSVLSKAMMDGWKGLRYLVNDDHDILVKG
jgi:hypothetical protein